MDHPLVTGAPFSSTGPSSLNLKILDSTSGPKSTVTVFSTGGISLTGFGKYGLEKLASVPVCVQLDHGEDLECNGGHSSPGSGTSGFHTTYGAQMNDMLGQETDKGIFTAAGDENQSETKLAEIRDFAKAL